MKMLPKKSNYKSCGRGKLGEIFVNNFGLIFYAIFQTYLKAVPL